MSTLKDKAEAILQEKEEKILPENIKKDVVAFGVTGELVECDTSDANATNTDILYNKTAYVDGEKLVGTMANNGSLNYTPSTSSQNIPAGYTSGGTISAVTSSIDANIQQNNIKAGVTILGVTGNVEPDKPDQTKTVTPTTSNQVIEPDTGYELASVTVNGVTSAIDSNITAGNIKKDVSILGVTGTYEGGSSSSGAKIFATEQQMQADPTRTLGDLAIVYGTTEKGMDADSVFSRARFPSVVVLDSPFTDNYLDFQLSSVDTSTYYSVSVSLTTTQFTVRDYEEISITYTSSDATTYTRTDGGEEYVDFETAIKYEDYGSRALHPDISSFIKVSTSAFNGLFEYKEHLKDSTQIHLILKSGLIITDEVSVYLTDNCFDTPYYDSGLFKRLTDKIVSDFGYTYQYSWPSDFAPRFFVNTNDELCFMTSGSSFVGNADIIIDSNLQIVGLGSKDNTLSTIKVYKITNTETCTYQLLNTYTGVTDTNGSYILYTDFKTIPVYVSKGSSYTNCSGSIRFVTDIGNTAKAIKNIDFYKYYDAYVPASQQLDATADFVYKDLNFFGKSVEIGTLTDNVSNTFADVNARVFTELKGQYDNMTPRVLQNGDTVDKSMYMIYVKPDGTPMLDTSNVTNMNTMFQSCVNLVEFPLLDTSNVTNMESMLSGSSHMKKCAQLSTSGVTNMKDMFNSCSQLQAIPNLNTANVTNMQGMAAYCSSITEFPQLDLSNCTNIEGMIRGCKNLVTVPVLSTSKVTDFWMFVGSCDNLSNESLNNILLMLKNMILVSSNKTLKYAGLSSTQATTCTSLSNWSACYSLGWRTGY